LNAAGKAEIGVPETHASTSRDTNAKTTVRTLLLNSIAGLRIVDESSWVMWSLEDGAAAMSLTEQAAPGLNSRMNT
jgi:hypothetical protein